MLMRAFMDVYAKPLKNSTNTLEQKTSDLVSIVKTQKFNKRKSRKRVSFNEVVLETTYEVETCPDIGQKLEWDPRSPKSVFNVTCDHPGTKTKEMVTRLDSSGRLILYEGWEKENVSNWNKIGFNWVCLNEYGEIISKSIGKPNTIREQEWWAEYVSKLEKALEIKEKENVREEYAVVNTKTTLRKEIAYMNGGDEDLDNKSMSHIVLGDKFYDLMSDLWADIDSLNYIKKVEEWKDIVERYNLRRGLATINQPLNRATKEIILKEIYKYGGMEKVRDDLDNFLGVIFRLNLKIIGLNKKGIYSVILYTRNTFKQIVRPLVDDYFNKIYPSKIVVWNNREIGELVYDIGQQLIKCGSVCFVFNNSRLGNLEIDFSSYGNKGEELGAKFLEFGEWLMKQ